MARRDQLTNKKAMSGNTRSHAMNHSRRRWNLNLQYVTIKTENGGTQRVKVSAKTMKTLRKHNMLA
ncbi:50S ribosomal protein L28 [Ureaplasma miroungigenitalium]|uniref:Large ribosomal subunit protein bL28 n=1 Tax=Ureaplasma miroungigenitalium TaxID=1042321 RepID=A0ABT3BML1_9BACT|nr:50S ribosomal protein L28 [Ureaplasma miroungigenitalium]MCV3728464.1 50S ribosomal protein L28 [Ureaplasma miroungigenitalium]MCV3734251.1 50S ribosomal protein L28 [Ureaplasma miroungigenitalium]